VSEAGREELSAQVSSKEAGVNQAEALLEKARAEVADAEAMVQVATADAQRAEAMLGYRQILAPYDGVITLRNVEVGDLTEADARGRPLLVLSRLDVVRAVVGVPEMQARLVKVGAPVKARVQALGGRVVEGRVSRLSGVLDPQNRTLRVEADLPGTDGLAPGYYVTLAITLEEHRDVLTLPATAIIRDAGKAACVVVADGKATRRAVTTGLDDGTRIEIASGLGGDELVVKTGGAALSEGQAVEAAAAKAP
jgi:RND family efflux transporter MFP subunit